MSHRVSSFATKLPLMIGTALIALWASASFATRELAQSATS